MKKPEGFYESQLKDALQTEADKRELAVEGTGANGAITKDDLVMALQIDDETQPDEPNQPPAPLPELKASLIPQVGLPSCPKVADSEVPPQDDEFVNGTYKMRSFISRVDSDGNEKRESTIHPGESFALCIHPANTYGRTHSLKNSLHYWEGTIGQFEAFFEKA